MKWFVKIGVIVFLFCTAEAMHKKEVKHPKLVNLLENFKLYKTTNCCSHAGDLYEHSSWVANVVENWWRKDNFWVKGLASSWKKVTILSGLLHDVGKAGDLNFSYNAKKYHPRTGFEYLLNKRPYFVNSALKRFNFDRLFKELGLTEEERKVVAILTGIHWDFGGIIVKGIAKGHSKPKLFKLFLDKLRYLAQEAGYRGGTVDADLLKMAILVGAADTKGADKVDAAHNYFGLPELKKPHPMKKVVPYKRYDVRKVGKVVCKELLDYLPLYHKQTVTHPQSTFSQSEAHWNIPMIGDAVRLTYEKEVKQHRDLINAMISKEKEILKEPYGAFYHSYDIEYYVLQDIYKTFYKLFYPLSDTLSDFELLRFPGDPLFNTYKSVKEFIENEIDKNTQIDDSLKSVRAFVIAANLALFGNVGVSSECTFDYFVRKKSHGGALKIKELTEKMLQLLKVPTCYAKELSELADMVRGHGAIAQIFIPLSVVDKYAYFARSWGAPHGNALALGYLFNRDIAKDHRMDLFWKMLDKNPQDALTVRGTVSEVLGQFRKAPISIPNFNRLQVRLLLTSDMLLSPGSGVKIIRYTTIPQDRLKLYKDKLQALADKIFAEFIQKKNKPKS